MKLKICGVQNVEEAILLANQHIDFIGLNFVPSSKRHIDVTTASRIVDTISGQTIPVALFQDAEFESVVDTMQVLNITHVQLHGSESSEYCKGLSDLGYKVIKSVPLSQTSTAKEAEAYMVQHKASLYLLDRATQGTGDLLNPEIAKELSKHHSVFLAGGINPENLSEIIQKLGTSIYGIDIAGGVRDELALNLNKLDKVIEIMRNA